MKIYLVLDNRSGAADNTVIRWRAAVHTQLLCASVGEHIRRVLDRFAEAKGSFE